MSQQAFPQTRTECEKALAPCYRNPRLRNHERTSAMQGGDVQIVEKTGLLLRALSGAPTATPPLWLMRQAGRYLPEYRELRAKAPSFLDFCFNPALAAEATLQPIRRFGFDAAILFSDILVIPEALGQRVSFVEGEGPQLRPIESAADFAALAEEADLGAARSGFRDRRAGARPTPRRDGADRLLRRALDGGELHDRRPWHA